MILFLDNYDSFTYNLVHYFAHFGVEIVVKRNDQLSVDEALALKPEAIVISPGPCDPIRAGISVPLVHAARQHQIPLFGVCLGHQSIGEAFGAKIIRAPEIMHGKMGEILHENRGVFADIPSPFLATRYHSLTIDPETLPDELIVTARVADGTIMGVEHRDLPIHGVQFHPESIASEYGFQIIENFLNIANIPVKTSVKEAS